jgi:hypothetical protein
LGGRGGDVVGGARRGCSWGGAARAAGSPLEMLDRAWLAWLGNKPAARCVKFIQAAGGKQNRAVKCRVVGRIPEKK